MKSSRYGLVLSAALLALALLAACTKLEQLGYTNRVLHRIPSPDGRVLAVCQEIPEFDGPSYALRLERPDGSVVRHLYEIGDGDPCSEMAWSPDGKTLGVLSSHVARVIFVDVAWALQHPSISTSAHSWRWAQAAEPNELRAGDLPRGKHLRFLDSSTAEIQYCPYSLEASRRTHQTVCTQPAVARVLRVPQPVYTGHS